MRREMEMRREMYRYGVRYREGEIAERIEKERQRNLHKN